MSVSKLDFFEDIAISMDSWVDAASNALVDPQADLIWVEDQKPYRMIQESLVNAGVGEEQVKQIIAECLRGFAVSILTALDGGTELAQKGRIYLINESGEVLGDDLHDGYVSHLFDSGRLR